MKHQPTPYREIHAVSRQLYRIIRLLEKTPLTHTKAFAEDTYVLLESELRHHLEKEKINRNT
jgi:hypothetical protein